MQRQTEGDDEEDSDNRGIRVEVCVVGEQRTSMREKEKKRIIVEEEDDDDDEMEVEAKGPHYPWRQ